MKSHSGKSFGTILQLLGNIAFLRASFSGLKARISEERVLQGGKARDLPSAVCMGSGSISRFESSPTRALPLKNPTFGMHPAVLLLEVTAFPLPHTFPSVLCPIPLQEYHKGTPFISHGNEQPPALFSLHHGCSEQYVDILHGNKSQHLNHRSDAYHLLLLPEFTEASSRCMTKWPALTVETAEGISS